jgi:small subunit ribosomal protein S3Ae
MQAVLAQSTAWDLTTMVNGIVSGEISRDLFKTVKTIYPTRRVEVVKSKVEPIAAKISTA